MLLCLLSESICLIKTDHSLGESKIVAKMGDKGEIFR